MNLQTIETRPETVELLVRKATARNLSLDDYLWELAQTDVAYQRPSLAERYAAECANFDPSDEKALAEEGMAQELQQWPEY